MAGSPLAVDFCGLKLRSPIVLLSGCVGFGDEYTRVEGFSNADAGAIVCKGTTLEPRLGNKAHRLWETTGGMLNAIGLQNPGADAVAQDIAPRLNYNETCWFANICGSTVEEYAEVARLSPNQTDIAENARRCLEAGADGLAVINTLMGMAIDAENRRPVIGNVQGGLSGPAIKPLALLKVHQTYQVARKHNAPIIGQGGIMNAVDAIEFLLAGATTVGVGTALFYDPLVCKKINAGIADYLAERNIASVADLTGALKLGPSLENSPVSG